jgi:hypothetical protein
MSQRNSGGASWNFLRLTERGSFRKTGLCLLLRLVLACFAFLA